LPDFGVIKVNYIPDKVLIELRSFKYYLLSYRNVGIYQEHVVNRILEDLVHVSKTAVDASFRRLQSSRRRSYGDLCSISEKMSS